ncbi:ribosomal protein S20 [Mobiluncus curtisii ATCC 51333]|uniref:Small ribosomal subunit protein bS20 n=1 Tax=Mobiluncus curtisii ATCC 51333 TaxID=887326 RepID=E6LXU2_9ACTO|nr:ribosomal protein S20 [Mobiluncus curtisii ATCC 51333]
MSPKPAKINTFEGRTLANIKSQIKRIRTNEKARLRNLSVRSELKTLVRKTREAIEAGDKAAAEANLKVATRHLDVAASKGVIHKNQAAQRKSKLATRVAAMQ